MNELEPFRQFLVSLLTETRETATKTNNTTVKAVLHSNVALLEQITMFISKSIKEGVIDMDKAKSEIKVLDEGVVEELGRSSREKGAVTLRVIELANELKPKGYVKIDPRGIERKSLEQKIYNLRGKHIPEDVFPRKKVNGEEGLFLVKLTKEQMNALPKRTKKVNGN